MTTRPPGTQPERAALAAHRTAAATLVVALALIRTAAHRRSLAAGIAGASAGLLSLVALALSRYSRADDVSALSFPRVGATAALAVALVSSAGLAIAFQSG